MEKPLNIEKALKMEKSLKAAIETGNTKRVAKLLERGANPNAYTVNCLTLAIECRLPISVELLLKAGAHPDRMDHKDDFPLLIAARYGDVYSTVTLLKAGADINQQNFPGKRTALMECASKGDSRIAQVLLNPPIRTKEVLFCCCAREYGDYSSPFHPDNLPLDMLREIVKNVFFSVDIDRVDGKGWSALHYAAEYTSYRLTEILLNHGADSNQISKNGNTPLDMAKCQNLFATSKWKCQEVKDTIQLLENVKYTNK